MVAQIIIQDDAAERYRILPDRKAVHITLEEWPILSVYRIEHGSERVYDEIVTNEAGEVELLSLFECGNCDGCGGLTFEPMGRLWFPSSAWASNGGIVCLQCKGSGKVWESRNPPVFVRLDSLLRQLEAA